MPWKELSRMDEKLRFVADCLLGEETMTSLCERYGISRDTGYLWKRRYDEEGAKGLEERSRAPLQHGRLTDAAATERIIGLRRKRPFWGAKKLLRVLRDEDPSIDWPACSTATDILRRAGLVKPRRRVRSRIPMEQPFAEIAAPNDTWCIDFKGWFRTRDGERCDPLTVTDAFSRYLLCCKIMPEQTAPVQLAVDRLFMEYGLPSVIRSDNGTPFSSTAVAGLSCLSVRWLKLGIGLERIDLGHPEQNGRHERMHATLKAETTRPPAATLVEQQKRFDRFRKDFNCDRPHEALGQDVPADHYRQSLRQMPRHVPEPWYDADHQVRRVRQNGDIRWNGNMVFISESLAGEPVGIAETEHGNWLVRFSSVDLGFIDRRTNKLVRIDAARPSSRDPKKTGKS
jgi:putative transposase